MSDQDGLHDERRGGRWSVEISVSRWSDVLLLRTTNLRRGGLFVQSQQPIEADMRVDLTVVLPDGGLVEIHGRVAHVVTQQQSEETGLAAGFGLRLGEAWAVDAAVIESMPPDQVDEAASTPEEGSATFESVIFLDGVEVERTSAHHAAMPASDVVDDFGGDDEGLTKDDKHMPDLAILQDLPEVPPLSDGPEFEAFSGPPTEQMQAEPVDITELEPEPSDTDPDNEAVGDAAPMVEQEPDEARPGAASSPIPLPRQSQPEIPQLTVSSDEAIFGIDFGTSYTSIALADSERVRLLEDSEGQTLLPSVVCFTEDGEAVVGWPAREKMLTNPATTFMSPKRLLGRRYDDRQVEPFIGASPVQMEEGPHGLIVARVYGEPIAMPQVCAHIFNKVASIGEQATGIPVRRVLISAPVGYQDERKHIRRAAELAGLQVVGIVDEPVAASMAYGLGRTDREVIAVYDFGGGTFDFTLLEIKDRQIEVIGEAGDAWLGGDDFDSALGDEAANTFWRRYKVDLRKRQVEWQRVLFHCEAAKRRLSSQERVTLHAPGIVLSLKGPIDLKVRFDREKFTELCGPLVDQSIELIDTCMGLIEVRPRDVDHIVMTGGVSRIPLVRQRVEEYFQKEARLAINPEHAIVLGNAIYARFLQLTGRAPVA